MMLNLYPATLTHIFAKHAKVNIPVTIAKATLDLTVESYVSSSFIPLPDLKQPHAGLPQYIMGSIVQYNSKRTSLVAMHIVILAAVITWYPGSFS